MRAAPASIIDAVATYRPEDDPLFRVLIGVRELPMRVLSSRPRPRQFGMEDFTLLARTEDAIVFGLAGAFWKSDFGLHRFADGTAFQNLQTPGIAKLILGFSVIPGAEGSNRLATETRVFCLDHAARRRFTPYWYLIRPVSGLIRRRILSSVKKSAEPRSVRELA